MGSTEMRFLKFYGDSFPEVIYPRRGKIGNQVIYPRRHKFGMFNRRHKFGMFNLQMEFEFKTESLIFGNVI